MTIGRTCFPALGAGYTHNLQRILIGSLRCVRVLGLVRVITLVLVLRHSNENRSKNDGLLKMAHLTAVTLILVNFAFARTLAVDHELRLKSYSEDGAEGCYEYNQTLAVCFDLKKDSMKVQKTRGQAIVHYQELGPDIFLYQVLGHDFIG